MAARSAVQCSAFAVQPPTEVGSYGAGTHDQQVPHWMQVGADKKQNSIYISRPIGTPSPGTRSIQRST
jgi:hypothetical protein